MFQRVILGKRLAAGKITFYCDPPLDGPKPFVCLPNIILWDDACSKADDDDDGDRVPDLPRDESAVTLNFPLEMSGLETEIAAASGSGGLSEVLRVGLFPLPPIDCGDGDSAAAAASFPPELKALFAYEPCAAFLPTCSLTIV